jgi:hypothetical protein
MKNELPIVSFETAKLLKAAEFDLGCKNWYSPFFPGDKYRLLTYETNMTTFHPEIYPAPNQTLITQFQQFLTQNNLQLSDYETQTTYNILAQYPQDAPKPEFIYNQDNDLCLSVDCPNGEHNLEISDLEYIIYTFYPTNENIQMTFLNSYLSATFDQVLSKYFNEISNNGTNIPTTNP